MNPERLHSIRRIVDDLESNAERVVALRDLSSPQELLALAEYYSWSDGLEIPTAILNHPQCDLGLALNLFRLADGFAWFTESHDWAGQQEWAAFCQFLAARVHENYYVRVEIAYEPGLSAAQRLKAKKAGVPAAFLTSILPA